MVAIRPDEISSIIRQQIEDYASTVKVTNVGTVLQVGDGIARVYGLNKVMAGELLEFEDGTVGIALNLEADNVGVVLMGGGYEIQEGKLGLGFSIFNNFNEKEYIFSDGDFLNKLEGNSDLYNSFWINE